jgi:hypothetical protein
MSSLFFEALDQVARAWKGDGYGALRTPKALYDEFDGGKLFKMLVDHGVDPTCCWTARTSKNGKAYLAPPGLNMIEGKIHLLFNFEGSGRTKANMIDLSEGTYMYSGVVCERSGYIDYTILIGGVTIPLNLNADQDSPQPPIMGLVSNLTIRPMKTGGGFGTKLSQYVIEKCPAAPHTAILSIDSLEQSDGKFGTNYTAVLSDGERVLLTPGAGRDMAIQLAMETLTLPANLRFELFKTDLGHWAADLCPWRS